MTASVRAKSFRKLGNRQKLGSIQSTAKEEFDQLFFALS